MTISTPTAPTADPTPAPGHASGPFRRALARVARWWGSVNRRRLAFRLVIGVFLVAIIASYAVPLWFQLQGDRLLVVTSGSMEPEIAVGSAVVVRPVTSPSQLRPGQVVTFWPIAENELVTHRIVALVQVPLRSQTDRTAPAITTNGQPVTEPYIQTKGDNNQTPDPNLTPIGQVRGIVRDVHPGWGYLLAFAHSGTGRFLLFVPPLLMLLISELFSRVPDRWQRSQWNRTILAIRRRESASAGPLARRTEDRSGVGPC